MKQGTIEHLEKLIKKHASLEVCKDSMLEVFGSLLTCYESGGKILICGNGGSAADSNHIVGELLKGFLIQRPLSNIQLEALGEASHLGIKLQNAIPAISLCEHSALMSAVSNDVDPEMVFAQQVYGLGKKNDVLIGISTSGNAKNVVNALLVANAVGIKTVALTGISGGQSKGVANISICVPETETYLIQELHLPVYHCLCAMLEEEIFNT